MKLLTLNIWGGTVYEPLLEFIKKNATDTDVFCFQEVLFGDDPGFTEVSRGRTNIFNEISSILTEFNAYKRTTKSSHFQRELIAFGAGQAIFVKKNTKVEEDGEFYCYDEFPSNSNKGGKLTGSFQWVSLDFDGKKTLIGNLHGLWLAGVGKIDTPERLTQSKKIKTFLNTRKERKILCGDFNLNPDGNSIAILEEGMKNLVKEYKIQSTRSDFYKKSNRFADYILSSLDINVGNFEVLQDQVSDHLPLV